MNQDRFSASDNKIAGTVLIGITDNDRKVKGVYLTI